MSTILVGYFSILGVVLIALKETTVEIEKRIE